MEYQLLFPLFVFTMAGIDLIARAARFLGGERRDTSRSAGRRDDWYVFFRCRDLRVVSPGSVGRAAPRGLRHRSVEYAAVSETFASSTVLPTKRFT